MLLDCIVIVGEGKSSQSLKDQIIESGGVVLSELPTDVSQLIYYVNGFICYSDIPHEQVCPAKTFLLADKARRTAKYFLALASGVPCIRPLWAKDCLKQVHRVCTN